MKATSAVDKQAKKVNDSKGKKGAAKPSIASLKKAFHDHILYTLAKDKFSATKLDLYKGLGLTVKDQLIKRWIRTQQTYYEVDAKRVYYISLEFLMGRLLLNNLINLQLKEEFARSVKQAGMDLEDLAEMATDAGLGNGGLGRLAACFLDSMATMELPAYGYGIRYEYGIFYQHIRDGYQVETPDNWLRYGNVWEIGRPEYTYNIKFHGKVAQYKDKEGILRNEWVDTQDVMAMAYDIPIPGYGNNTVNNLRLWSAKSTREFDFDYFNHGDYIRAVQEKAKTETISKVLYPNDNIVQGKELRLKQEYFCVSATLQDIIRRYLKAHQNFDQFPDKVAVQLNDTHPAISVAELMRILVDQHHLDWDKAWDIVIKTFGYTNHTVLPEALEKWPLSLLESVLPRHVQIIFEINRRFLENIAQKFPGDNGRPARMSLIEEGPEKNVRMAYLAVVGSHSVNGVAALHSEILKKDLFKDFYEMFPDRFNNKTNGITQRRWLLLCNPDLSNLITKSIGDSWVTDLYKLKALVPFSTNKSFQKEWRKIKQQNKVKLSDYIGKVTGIRVTQDSMFDVQVKRIHEYKRQLLNLLHIVHMYNGIKANPDAPFVPRTMIFAGKAAPGYFLAKLIIKLINSVGDVVNRDTEVGEKLKVAFLPNYCVSQAEKIIPAAELSEQISTAGKEASGTGNMKLSLNGALTIGTLDGANIEIKEEVGDDNIFIFGLTAEEVQKTKESGYNPMEYYERIPSLKKVLDQIASGYFSPGNPELFKPIIESLLYKGDPFLLLADFESYVACQEVVSKAYMNQEEWARKSILNVANMGKFSSDRTIAEYVRDIWHAEPVHVTMETELADV